MQERLAEQFIEDETLTAGLSDEDASELVGWLAGIAEELEEQNNPLRQQYVAQLKRLGHEVSRLARRHKIPVETLIDLIELAWEEPEENRETKPIQA